MNELDAVWSQMLENALAGTEAAGRSDVAEYLRLKAGNDAIRQKGVQWLMDSVIEIATEHDPEYRRFTMEREEPHNFTIREANMVGSALRVRLGVRCMTLEAGWTRTPKDGFMRGGSLAQARITHFGIPKERCDLMLVKTDALPEWYRVEDGRKPNIFLLDDLRRHFDILKGA